MRFGAGLLIDGIFNHRAHGGHGGKLGAVTLPLVTCHSSLFIRLGTRMNSALADLANALRERRTLIHDEESRRDETAHIARLKAVSEKIDKLQAALPRPLDAQLAHYLKRKSYDKALELLEGRSTAL
jgi:hypothetical protein